MDRKWIIQFACKGGLTLSSTLFAVLTGCTTYVDQTPPRQAYYEEPPRPREVYVAPTPVVVETSYVGIRAENDFYEPLSPYGRWEVVGAYGRCWIPARVETNWRPYSNGYWQRTDAGWYWASDEPWAWATYHYGRWDVSPELGWYWVPQTQWAPAWVSWHHGGGYVGWAPLQPSVRIGPGGVAAVNVGPIAPRAMVLVEERRFLEPVRPATVVVNNTTIINKTVNITNIKVVNNTVVNEGPRTTVIEQVSGQKVQAVPVLELRRKQEAQVVARQRIPAPAVDRSVRPTVPSETAPRESKAIPAPASPQIEKPAVIALEPARPAPEKHEPKNEKGQVVPSAAEAKVVHRETPPSEIKDLPPPASRPIEKSTVIEPDPARPAPEKHEPKNEKNQAFRPAAEARPAEVKPVAKSDAKPEAKRPAPIQEPSGQKTGKHGEKPDKRAEELKKKVQPVPLPRGQPKDEAIKRGATNSVIKVHPTKVEEPPTPPEKPALQR